MARRNFMRTIFLEGVADIYTQQLLSDVEVEVEEEKFQCHRLVLSAVSPFFRAMFLSGLTESRSGRVQLPDITAEAFRAILQVIYLGEGGDGVLTNENVQDVHFAACILGLESLAAEAEVFIISRLSNGIVLNVWRHAQRMNQRTMERNAASYVAENFPAFRSEGQVTELTMQELADVISSDYLNVKDEEDVLQTVLEWIEVDRENRASLFPDLADNIRFCLLDVSRVSKLVQGNDLFAANSECQQVMEENLQTISDPVARWQVNEESSRPRKGHCLEVGVVLYGKLVHQKHNRALPFIAEFGFYSQRFLLNGDCPFWKELRNERAVCGNGDWLYVCGAVKCFQYHTLTHTWTRLPDLPTAFRGHAILAHRHSLYVIGGWNTSERQFDVYVIDVRPEVEKPSWRPFGCLQKKVSNFGTAIAENSIFVFGGYAIKSEVDEEVDDVHHYTMKKTADIQRLDLTIGQCDVVASLSGPWSGAQAVHLPDGNIYLFHTSGIVESFCPSSFALQEVWRLRDMPSDSFAVVPHQTTLYSFSQCRGEEEEEVSFGGMHRVRYLADGVRPEGFVKCLVRRNPTGSAHSDQDPSIYTPLHEEATGSAEEDDYYSSTGE